MVSTFQMKEEASEIEYFASLYIYNFECMPNIINLKKNSKNWGKYYLAPENRCASPISYHLSRVPCHAVLYLSWVWVLLWLTVKKRNRNTKRHKKSQDLGIIKDSKITMLKDRVVNMYSNMNKNIGNYSREMETILIVKNRREMLDWKISE